MSEKEAISAHYGQRDRIDALEKRVAETERAQAELKRVLMRALEALYALLPLLSEQPHPYDEHGEQ